MAKAPTQKSTKKSPEHEHEHEHDEHAHDHDDKPAKKAGSTNEGDVLKARERLGAAGRNDPCPCGSGKKY